MTEDDSVMALCKDHVKIGMLVAKKCTLLRPQNCETLEKVNLIWVPTHVVFGS